MLRDRLVCGVRDEALQRRLLAETALDFKKAYEKAVAAEYATRQTAAIRGALPAAFDLHRMDQAPEGAQARRMGGRGGGGGGTLERRPLPNCAPVCAGWTVTGNPPAWKILVFTWYAFLPCFSGVDFNPLHRAGGRSLSSWTLPLAEEAQRKPGRRSAQPGSDVA
ncbi:hypothetical protein MTO96_042852 [Rhipicephalus appendiculatus]